MGDRLSNPTTGRFTSPTPNPAATPPPTYPTDPINQYDLNGHQSYRLRHQRYLRHQSYLRRNRAYIRHRAYVRKVFASLTWHPLFHQSPYHVGGGSPSQMNTSYADWGMAGLGTAAIGIGVLAGFVTMPLWLTVGATVVGVGAGGYTIYRLFRYAPF